MKTRQRDDGGDSRKALQEVLERLQQISAENEKLAGRLADGEFRFRHLAKAVWQVQEEERRSIALELHDGIGQILTALINHLRHSTGDATGAGSDESIELATTALTEVRRLSRALRPSVLDDLGLEAALNWLIRTTGEASGLDVRLSWTAGATNLDKESETLVFRVVQEALTNAVKHAKATRARVIGHHAEGRLQVSISDNGEGFDAAAALAATDAGFGVRGMRDRAELFGGKLTIESGRGDGTSITLDMPESPQ